MRSILIAAGSLLIWASASAAEYTSVTLEKTIERPADVVWAKVGPFCALRDWLKTTCEYTSGSGGLGTVRLVAGRFHEVLVGRTEHSYTYAFAEPNPTMYHGTLSVVPAGAHRSKLIYILFWDQETLPTPEAKAADRDRRTQTFSRALDNMKAMTAK